MTRAAIPKARYARFVIAALIAAKLAVLFALAWNRRFVMDEFEQLGWAKYVGNGFYDTIWPAKAVGFQLFIKSAHLIGWDARSILLIGRMEMALLACATLAIVYGCARALREPPLRAALIVLILLCFSNFVERIIETRAEPLAVFFAAGALLVAIRGDLTPGRIVTAGALSGLAFVTTQKSIYFDVALGLALVGDALVQRRLGDAGKRGAWLIAGWAAPVTAYCLIFGGADPLRVADSLFFGPRQVASAQTAAEYGGLRQYVVQTLARNLLLYLFAFAGMIVTLLRIRSLQAPERIALIFSIVITALVFAHNQPWPYVFVMALPFIALWALRPLDAATAKPVLLPALWSMLAVAVAASFVNNVHYFGIGNHGQLALVSRAERFVGANEIYFDAVGMLPNRKEPSTLWLDRHTILETLRDGKQSEAYRIFAEAPPKVVIWTYRMDSVAPLLAPLVRDSYVQVAPNLRLAGVRLQPGKARTFDVPIAGAYALYDARGRRVDGALEVDGRPAPLPVTLAKGRVTVRFPAGQSQALLVIGGDYAGSFAPGADDRSLFEKVYD